MNKLTLHDRKTAIQIVLWAIDHGVADGNPWIIRLALVCGEDHGYRIRIWRQTDTSTFAEDFVYLTNWIPRDLMWKIWAKNLKSHQPMKIESYNSFDMALDNL